MWEKPETKCRQSIVRLYVKLRCLRINLLISPENMRRLASILLLVPHSFGMGVCLQIWVQQRLI